MPGFRWFRQPVQIDEAAVRRIMLSLGASKDKPLVDWQVGDKLKVTEGPFEGFSGVASEVLAEKGTIRASINIFGRDTLVELEWTQIEKL